MSAATWGPWPPHPDMDFLKRECLFCEKPATGAYYAIRNGTQHVIRSCDNPKHKITAESIADGSMFGDGGEFTVH